MTIQDRITQLVEEGCTTSKIRAHLTIEDFGAKEISEALKEAGVVTQRITFRSGYYDFLVDSAPTVEEAGEYIDTWCKDNAESSSNVERNKKAFLRDAELAVRIRGTIED